MSKSSTIRIFQLAKELGVASKDLIDKCEAEGIPSIKNHMSTVSPGLAATVREWFGGGNSSVQTTAVQTAAPVDVLQARAKAQRKPARRKSGAGLTEIPDEVIEPGGDEGAAPVVEVPTIAEPQADQPEEALEVEELLEVPEFVAEAADEAADAAPGAAEAELAALPALEQVAPDAGDDAGDGEVAVSDDRPSAAPMNVPKRPHVVKPAGPMLQQPTRTKLAGPRIIRVEQPEVIQRPDSRPDSGSGIRRGGPRAGRGAGVSLPEPTEVPAEPVRGGRSSRRNKRRSAVAREETGRVGKAQVSEEQPFNWRTQDLREREARLNRSGGFFKAHRRDNLKRSIPAGARAVTAAQVGGAVRVEQPITIKNLSAATGVKAADILKKLFLAGTQATVNSAIDAQTAVEIMLEHNIELAVVEQKSAADTIRDRADQVETLDARPRSPVVTILGHVDHGKTSLLDKIRNANVAAGEAGGITQKTSAFQVPVHAGDRERLITFIDTPGHEAFTQMRARGANVTDLVVLVVAADDGVMPQTVESINHAKAAGVPIVVALNKIDKPEATEPNITRILGQLAGHELNPVEWGGTTEVIRTSAVRGDGVQDLLEVLDYQAELLEITADFDRHAEGTVLEAKIEEGRGSVANILVQEGTLKRGNFVVAGRAFGRVRDIVDDRGQRLDEAVPGMPVAISGIGEVPDAGDRFFVVASLKEAENAARERLEQERTKSLFREKLSLDRILQKISKDGAKELALVIKTDVQGSLDALAGAVQKLSTGDVTIVVKHAAVGGVNESDIVLADAAQAVIMGFNVTTTAAARQEAEARGVDIRLYDIIYDLIDDVTRAAEGLLEPEHRLEVLGHADVRQVFRISRVGMIAGCYVTDGVIERNAQIRVTRDGVVVEKDRRLAQLKRFKDDAKEVRNGQECGMRIDGYDDIKVGDVLECYKTTEVKRTL